MASIDDFKSAIPGVFGKKDLEPGKKYEIITDMIRELPNEEQFDAGEFVGLYIKEHKPDGFAVVEVIVEIDIIELPFNCM